MATSPTSPTPSFESLPGGNSIGSFGEPADYLSDSPLTLSGSSPPVSDSAICDDFSSGLVSSLDSQTSQSSNSSNGPRCTGCKSKQSDAVANCIECANYLCANCVTAHQYMHCFEGHSVFRINDTNGQPALSKIMNTFETNRLSVNLKDDSATMAAKLQMNGMGASTVSPSVIAPPQSANNNMAPLSITTATTTAISGNSA